MKSRGFKKQNQEDLAIIAVEVLPEETCEKMQFMCTKSVSVPKILSSVSVSGSACY